MWPLCCRFRNQPSRLCPKKGSSIKKKYDEDICEAIPKVATSFQPQIIKLLKMILPMLSTSFQRQKGDIFALGDYEESAQNAVTQMDPEKLEKVPIDNLKAERIQEEIPSSLAVHQQHRLKPSRRSYRQKAIRVIQDL